MENNINEGNKYSIDYINLIKEVSMLTQTKIDFTNSDIKYGYPNVFYGLNINDCRSSK